MNFGICNLNCIAIRKEPNNKSEMVSQLLFGETFQIVNSENQWIKIVLDFDFYEGWILKNQILELEEDTCKNIVENNSHISNELVTFITNTKGDLQTLTLGATLPFYKGNKFHISNEFYAFDGKTKSEKLTKNDILATAHIYLNTPFLWGGKTPFGMDSSGFTQMVYKINGHALFRDAHQQASQGEVLSFIEESTPGDLAFFDNEEGEIIHVGIILANHYIIHCDEKVRIDRLDQSGIYNVDTKRHTHKLRVMKQIF